MARKKEARISGHHQSGRATLPRSRRSGQANDTAEKTGQRPVWGFDFASSKRVSDRLSNQARSATVSSASCESDESSRTPRAFSHPIANAPMFFAEVTWASLRWIGRYECNEIS
jgi:hypothetical protein